MTMELAPGPGGRPAASMESSDLLLNDIGAHAPPVLPHEEQARLALAAQAGDDAARARLVASSLRLVVSRAKKWTGHRLEFAELVSIGTLGLMKAVDAYDASRGARFVTCAALWIDQAIRRAVQETAYPIRLPAHIWDGARAAKKAETQVAASRILGGVASLDAAQTTTHRGLSEEARTLAELLPDPGAADPAARAAAADRRDRVAALLRAAPLTELERRTLVRYYGLDGREPETLQAIGDAEGVCREAVRLRLVAARRALREAAARHGVTADLLDG